MYRQMKADEHLPSDLPGTFRTVLFFLAGFRLWEVLLAGLEWWRNHSADCCRHVSSPDQEDGRMGGQRLRLWAGPSALRRWLQIRSQCRWEDLLVIIFLTGVTERNVSHVRWLWIAVRDVANWSPRMREPMEKMYGAEAFAQMWEAWVDGISQFARRSKGSEVTLFHIHDTNEAQPSSLPRKHPDQRWETRALHNFFFAAAAIAQRQAHCWKRHVMVIESVLTISKILCHHQEASVWSFCRPSPARLWSSTERKTQWCPASTLSTCTSKSRAHGKYAKTCMVKLLLYVRKDQLCVSPSGYTWCPRVNTISTWGTQLNSTNWLKIFSKIEWIRRQASESLASCHPNIAVNDWTCKYFICYLQIKLTNVQLELIWSGHMPRPLCIIYFCFIFSFYLCHGNINICHFYKHNIWLQ